MPIYLFDSSAILKRYLREVGTAWVDALVDPASGNAIYLVRIAGAEVVAAVARKQRGGGLSPAHASTAPMRFRSEFTSLFRLLDVDVGLIDRAMLLAERHGLAATTPSNWPVRWKSRRSAATHKCRWPSRPPIWS